MSAVAGLRELYESDEAQALAAPPNAAELLKLVDTVIRFTQAGTDGTQRRPVVGARGRLAMALTGQEIALSRRSTQPTARLPHKPSGSPPSGNTTDTALMWKLSLHGNRHH